MAGKSFRGVGDDEESSRRTEPDGTPQYEDDDDSRGVHSGPTVVDDKKVAEVLKKLRSLDRAPGPLTGVTEVVVDTNSSEQTRIDTGVILPDSAVARPVESGPTTKVDAGQANLQDIMYPLQRPTAIGRSLSTPTDVQPVTIPADAARGTLFGRSIHLPDVNAPDEASIELSSGAVEFVEGTAPSQPFPLAARPAVVLPAPTAQAQRFHTPYDTDPDTQLTDPRRSKVARVIALVAGVAAVAGGWFAWTHLRGQPTGAGPSAAPPAAATEAPHRASPSIVPIPAPASAPSPQPAAAAAAPAQAAPTEEPTPSAAATDERPTARKAPPAPERRPAAKIASPSDASAPGKRSRRHAAIPADPDATLPPSM